MTILNRHISFDVRVCLIIHQFKIIEFKIEDAFHIGINFHLREGEWLAAQLQFHLIHVIGINVKVAKGVDKIAGFKSGYLCHHHGEQRVGGNIERYPQKGIGTALIKLAG